VSCFWQAPRSPSPPAPSLAHRRARLRSSRTREFTGTIGSLCVTLDGGSPRFCLPVPLTELLSLAGGRAYVGFTAATGLEFQAHELLACSMCENC
jgi:hypothetical protein